MSPSDLVGGLAGTQHFSLAGTQRPVADRLLHPRADSEPHLLHVRAPTRTGTTGRPEREHPPNVATRASRSWVDGSRVTVPLVTLVHADNVVNPGAATAFGARR